MRYVIVLLLGVTAAGCKGQARERGREQTARGVSFRFDGDATEWRIAEPTFHDSSGDRAASIWVDMADSGLVVAGQVSGSAPHWPAKIADLRGAERIEIALADSGPPSFPPVGWAHQFGEERLRSAEDCASSEFRGERDPREREGCARWYQAQLAYRDTVKRLFQRRWRIAPGIIQESYATPAFEGLDPGVRAELEPLRPATAPVARFQGPDPSTPGGYTFEVVVPWSAFPPVRSLSLEAVRLSARVAGATTGDSMPLPVYQLPRVRQYHITPCGYGIGDSPPEDGDESRDRGFAYFVPVSQLDVNRIVVLNNKAAGYQYEPGPATRSPIATETRYWTRELSGGGTLCGPRLAFVRDGAVRISPVVMDVPGHLDVRELPNGDALLRDGPRAWFSYYGSGQCGACPRVGIEVYYLDRSTGEISTAMGHSGISEGGTNEEDIAISPDWSTIRIFEGSRTYVPQDTGVMHWKQTRHCYEPAKRKYEPCGVEENVPEPRPRSINLDSLTR